LTEPPFSAPPPPRHSTDNQRVTGFSAGAGRLSRGIPPPQTPARTFASGLAGPNDPSLLARLKSEILVFKDFTSVLALHRDERGAVLAQLREIYDGRYDTTWGTGKELHWSGRLGLLAGVTPVIDRHHGVMSVLGQRFVLLRLRQADRRAIARRAIANSLGGSGALSHIRAQVATFMASLPSLQPLVGSWVQMSRHRDYWLRTRPEMEVRLGYSIREEPRRAYGEGRARGR
jgi:hypothetical protein